MINRLICWLFWHWHPIQWRPLVDGDHRGGIDPAFTIYAPSVKCYRCGHLRSCVDCGRQFESNEKTIDFDGDHICLRCAGQRIDEFARQLEPIGPCTRCGKE